MSSPIWWSCSPSSVAIRPSARPRASHVITRRNSCSARPPWRRGPMTTISTIENDPARGEPRLAGAALSRTEPDRNCPLCPRLAGFREAARAREPEWFNSPVPSFGDPDGDLLYATLLEYGFAKGNYQARPDDGLTLVACRISNAVRCVPPQNKPLPAEISVCRQFLIATIENMPSLRAIVALGRVAHESTLKALGLRAAAAPFAHGAMHQAGAIKLYDSYHCSRYNTNTRVLTPAMFRNVFAKVRADLS